MKELSIEEKAQAYDKAIERAKNEYQAHKSFNGFCKMLEHIFPELKESGDEKIRKELLSSFKSIMADADEDELWYGLSYNDIIAWLEKQGNTNETINKDEFAQGILRGAAINLITWIDYSTAEGNMCLSNMECKDIENALVRGDWFKVYDYMKKKLEKQGEQKLADDVVPKFKVGDIIKPKDGSHEHWQIMQVDMFDKKYRFKDGYVIHFSQEDDYELVEQKPADKVEPKFKVGDWIISNNKKSTYQVIEVKRGIYVIRDNVDNHVYHIGIEECEKSGRFWDVSDAKDGDVLCDYQEAYDNPLIFILKKFERVNFGLVKPSDYSSYCFLTASDRQRFKEGAYHHKHNIKPATKEQCDLLFQKMKEAGYEWDASKKELKKIKHKFNIGDKIKTPNEEPLTITRIDGEGYWSNDLFICDFDSECIWDLVEQKPAKWNVEDEKMLNQIISIIKDADDDLIRTENISIYTNWLKSIKQRKES